MQGDTKNVIFTQVYDTHLYVTESSGGNRGWLGLALPHKAKPPGKQIMLSDALINTALNASFIFSTTVPAISTKKEIEKFLLLIAEVINKSVAYRGIIWLTKVENILPENSPMLPMAANGANLSGNLIVPLIPDTLTVKVINGTKLSLNQEAIIEMDNGSDDAVQFDGPSAPQSKNPTTASLPFTGEKRGCLHYTVSIERDSLNNKLKWGFYFLASHGDNAEKVDKIFSQWYPLASGQDPPSTDLLKFNASIDPADVVNATGTGLTAFTFTGKNHNNEKTILYSWYRTNFGHPLHLVPLGADTAGNSGVPARLVVNYTDIPEMGQLQSHFSPEGDFIISKAAENTGQQDNAALLCGLSGTESISFQLGDRLRFFSRKPAYAPVFPIKTASPVGKPVKPDAELLKNKYLTSWATVLRAEGHTGNIHYSAQPPGSNLYGKKDKEKGKSTGDDDNILVPKEPGVILPTLFPSPDPQLPANDTQEPFCVPMPPYAGVSPQTLPKEMSGNGMTPEKQLELFDQQIISPTRRNSIARCSPRTSSSRAATMRPQAAGVTKDYNVTTPSGLIAKISGSENGGTDGEWLSVQLAQNLKSNQAMVFNYPDKTLRSALQSNRLFMVVTNETHLGTFIDSSQSQAHKEDGKNTFANSISIENWNFQVKVGCEESKYNNYKNVMVFKFCPGALKDLVNKIDYWTDAGAFNFPENEEKLSELIIIAGWLQQYIDDGIRKYNREEEEKKEVKLYKKFHTVVTDPNWNGILSLKVDIDSLPSQLTGLLGGIDKKNFNAHHFGIEVSQVSGQDVTQKETSSMFGLIDYHDAAYDTASGDKPVPPPAGADYDFKVLTLNVLFQNSAVKYFKSLAQLTMNTLFGHTVDHMGDKNNIYNTVMLYGSMQHQNGQTIYMLDTAKDNSFYFNSNVLNKVEIIKAQFRTWGNDRKDCKGVAGDKTWINAGFELWGFMDFNALYKTEVVDKTEKVEIFDVFSFGSQYTIKEYKEDKITRKKVVSLDEPRKGLRFAGLSIDMKFQEEDSAQRCFSFDTSKITFDPAQSTPRNECLFKNFALEIDGLIMGNDKSTPADEGFLQVTTDIRMSGVQGRWNGLRFLLNMGSPGELAGKINLTSSLVLAWSPGSPKDSQSYDALVGLKLPGTGGGAKLLSLQGVLKLSIGTMRLIYVADKKSFLLLLSQIALKFLGIMKLPPNSASAFYLFGNPNADGKAGELGWYAVYKQEKSSMEVNSLRGPQPSKRRK